MVDDNPKIKLVDDDIRVVLSDESAGEGYDYNVKFLSLEGYDICWTKDQAELLKQQILKNQETVERLKKIINELEKKGEYGYTDNFIYHLIYNNMESTDGSDEVVSGINQKLKQILDGRQP